jgi:hypothetical protein
MCLKCPLVVTVLSKFALDYDPNFTFTTITINYNYASAPHQDVNHEDGRARIIAFGDFQGGELNLEGVGDVDIRNRWYDFDGTILHSTNPFVGERYSLVYFTHVSWKSEAADEIGRKLIALGVPWPAALPLTLLPTFPISTEDSIGDQRRSSEEGVSCECDYYFLPLKKRHQYETALPSEISSLCSLYLPLDRYHLFPPINSPLSEGDCALAYGLSVAELNAEHSSLMNAISDRAVTFTVWKRICSANSLESLFQSQVEAGWIAPQKFGIEIYSPGKQMSTRQKRKVLLLAQLSRPSSDGKAQHSDRHYQLCLLLEFDWSQADADGSQGRLCRVHLCEQIPPSGTSRSDLTTKQAKQQQPSVAAQTSSGDHHDNSRENLTTTPPSTALRPSLCQLLCNLAKISKYSLVYDPFCGSRSILRVAEELGGYCLGSDAFEKHLNLIPQEQQQQQGNIFISNIYHQQVVGGGDRGRGGGQFDAIICDPPYGRREKHVDEKGIDFANHQTSEERALSQFRILTPLLQLSSQSLKVGGRLVFLFLK